MLQDAVVRSGCEIIARLARHGDAADLTLMLELAMTAALRGQVPTVGLQHTKDFADFHARSIASATYREARDRSGCVAQFVTLTLEKLEALAHVIVPYLSSRTCRRRQGAGAHRAARRNEVNRTRDGPLDAGISKGRKAHLQQPASRYARGP